MEKELDDLLCRCANYMCGVEDSPVAIINVGADIYVKYANELPNILVEVLHDCLCYINKDFEDKPTLKQYIERGDELIEELTGTLGEYLQ